MPDAQRVRNPPSMQSKRAAVGGTVTCAMPQAGSPKDFLKASNSRSSCLPGSASELTAPAPTGTAPFYRMYGTVCIIIHGSARSDAAASSVRDVGECQCELAGKECGQHSLISSVSGVAWGDLSRPAREGASRSSPIISCQSKLSCRRRLPGPHHSGLLESWTGSP